MQSGIVKASDLSQRRNTVEEFYSPSAPHIKLLLALCPYELRPVGKFAQVKGGKRLPAATAYSDNMDGEDIPYVRTCDIRPDAGAIDLSDVVYIDEATHNVIKNYQLQLNDIVISIAGTIGAVGMLREPLARCNFNENMAKVRVSDDSVLPDFVAAYFAGEFGQAFINWSTGGAVQAKLSLERIKQILMPIPPKLVQENVIEAVNRAYQERRGLLREAEDLGRNIGNYLMEMLGASLAPSENKVRLVRRISELQKRDDPNYYSDERLNAIAEIRRLPYELKRCGDIAKVSKDRILPKNYPAETFNYLSLGNVQSHTGEITGKTVVLGEEILSQSTRFQQGDILFSRLRPYLNKVYYVDDDLSNGICSGEFYAIRPNDEIHGLFLTHYLLCPLVLHQARNAVTGSALPRLAKGDFADLEIPLISAQMTSEIVPELSRRRREIRQKIKRAEDAIVEARHEVQKLIIGNNYNLADVDDDPLPVPTARPAFALPGF